ncbi:MAG: site-2 protease family protein [Clostridia bacterium]|nr:site-2 protease family protein [Clostridia bacterium]
MIYDILDYISIFLALLIVLPFHEFAHGFAAVKSGDLTPKLQNRYTLNPFAHFDLPGLLCFLFAGFGWAKPVPINPNNFTNYKKGCFFVSIAGVVMNYVTSFIAYPLFILAIMFMPDIGYFDEVITYSLFYIFSFGITFAIFNLLPIYPLDGFRVVDVFNKKRGPVFCFLRDKGVYILYALIGLSVIADVLDIYQLDILGNFIGFVASYLQIPITWFWGLIF